MKAFLRLILGAIVCSKASITKASSSGSYNGFQEESSNQEVQGGEQASGSNSGFQGGSSNKMSALGVSPKGVKSNECRRKKRDRKSVITMVSIYA